MAVTYNTLVGTLNLPGQIIDYLQRPGDADTFNAVQGFITNAQQRIARDSKNIGFTVYVSGALSVGIGGAVFPKPGRWRRTITFNIGTGATHNSRTELEKRTYEFINSYWPDRTLLSQPLFYSDYGFSNYILSPTPDYAYPFELGYLELPPILSSAVQTNWLTNYAPDLLLYAILVEAEPYLRNKEDLPIWEQRYQQALASVNGQDDQRVVDRFTNVKAD